MPVTLTGTNFVVGATTVTVNSGGVTATNVIVGSTTSLTADIVITAAAVLGAHTVTVTTAGGTSGAQTFTVNPPPPAAPTLTSVSPNQGIRGTTVAVTLTGTNFVVGATTVNVAGGGVTVNNVVVGSTTSLTANFVLDLAARLGARTVTVTTAGGTSGGQTFTINVPTGSQTFNFTGSPETFTVPAGVVSITILATGAQGGLGFGALGGAGGLGGRTTATVSVTPGAVAHRACRWRRSQWSSPSLRRPVVSTEAAEAAETVAAGGGASSVRNGATSLVIVGGGGGGGALQAVRLSAAGTAAPAVVSSPTSGRTPWPVAVAAAGEAGQHGRRRGPQAKAPSSAPTEPLAWRIRVASVASQPRNHRWRWGWRGPLRRRRRWLWIFRRRQVVAGAVRRSRRPARRVSCMNKGSKPATVS